MLNEIDVQEFGQKYNIMELGLKDDWAVASADNGEERNALTIAWGSMGVLWSLPVFSVYIHKTRYSKHIFDKAKYFAVSIVLGENRPQRQKALSYLGTKSGRDEDKFAGAEALGFSVAEEEIDGEKVPYFADADYVVFCKMVGMTDFDLARMDAPERTMSWYEKEGVHTIYEGEMVKVLAKA